MKKFLLCFMVSCILCVIGLTACDKNTEIQHAHDYTKAVTNPTCTEQGYTTYTCACGDKYIANFVNASGHDMARINKKNQTCTANGNIEYYNCSVCNKKYNDNIGTTELFNEDIIILASHGETEIRNAKPATEEEKGYTGDTHCKVCEEKLSIGQEIDKLDHTHSMQKVDRVNETCNTNGNIEYYSCTKCNKNYNDNVGTTELSNGDIVITARHLLSQHNAKAPTCEDIGWSAYETCSRCDYSTYAELEKLEHEFTNYVSNNDGTKTATCNHNGCLETDTVDDAYYGFTFVEYLNGYSAVQYNGLETEVVVPSTYNNRNVVAIGYENTDGGFFYCDQIEKITLPNTIKYMGLNIFKECTSLATVDYLGTIDQWAMINFANQDSNPLCFVENVYIDGNELPTELNLTTATKIGSYAFYDCNITNVSIPNTCTSVGVCSLAYNNITHVTIPERLTSFGEGWLYENEIEKVTLAGARTQNMFIGDMIGVKMYLTITNETEGASDFLTHFAERLEIGAEYSDRGYYYFYYDLKDYGSRFFTVYDSTNEKNLTYFANEQADYYSTHTEAESEDFYYESYREHVVYYLPTSITGYFYYGLGDLKEIEMKSSSTISRSVLLGYLSGVKLTVDYHITYNLNGGTADNVKTYNEDTETFSLVEPTKEGYEFLGWTGTGLESITKEVTIPTQSSGHREYTAHWKANEYTLYFNGNGGSTPNSTSVYYDSTYGTLPTPTRTGYTFDGWYTLSVGGTKVDDASIVKTANEHTLYARWVANEYTLSFNGNGGSAPNSIQVTYDSAYGTLPTPTRTGYTFDGWYTTATGGTKVNSTDIVKITNTTTLYAQWTINEYKITFENGTGYTITATKNGNSFLSGEKITIKDTVVFTLTENIGYTKKYLTASGSNRTFSNNTLTNVYENITISGGATANQYKLSFYGNGIVNPSNKYVTYDSTYGTLHTVTRTGYTFDGWFTESSGGTKVESTTIVNTASAHTLYAHWTANEYTLSFNGNGGSTSNSIQVTYDSTYGTLPTPTRTGYTFGGWYTLSVGGTKVNDASIVKTANEHTLYAHWTANKYTLSLNGNGGSTPNSIQVTYDSAYGTLPTPTRTGYTFDGWYTESSSGTKVDTSTIVKMENAHTLYAHWFTDVVYTLSGSYYEVTGLTSGAKNNVEILGEYNSKSVIAIRKNAFEACNITSITIPNSVTSIGSSAFNRCWSLKTVTFGDNSKLESIGDYAFYACSALGTVTFGANSKLESIGERAFSNCSALESIEMPVGVTSIGSSAFSGCTGLTSITIPNSVTSIGNYAFFNCSNLTAINVDSNNLYYSSQGGILFNKEKTDIVEVPKAISGNIVLPNTLVTISDDAFNGCSTLESIEIPVGAGIPNLHPLEDNGVL